MNNEIFPLTLQTFNTIWNGNNTCDDSDNTFEIVRLGNTMRNRIYRLINKKLISNNCFSDNDCSLDEDVECNIFDFVSKNVVNTGRKMIQIFNMQQLKIDTVS